MANQFDVPFQKTCKCRVCGIVKQKIRSDKFTTNKKTGKKQYKYYDQDGIRWQSRCCRNCSNKEKIKKNRESGRHKPMDEVTFHPFKTGRISEHTARKYFEGLGYKVSMTTAHGPDLICEKDGFKMTVEVKTICKRKNYFSVSRVLEKRSNDNYIALVYKEKVFIQPMRYFLRRQINKKGHIITVSDLINQMYL